MLDEAVPDLCTKLLLRAWARGAAHPGSFTLCCYCNNHSKMQQTALLDVDAKGLKGTRSPLPRDTSHIVLWWFSDLHACPSGKGWSCCDRSVCHLPEGTAAPHPLLPSAMLEANESQNYRRIKNSVPEWRSWNCILHAEALPCSLLALAQTLCRWAGLHTAPQDLLELLPLPFFSGLSVPVPLPLVLGTALCFARILYPFQTLCPKCHNQEGSQLSFPCFSKATLLSHDQNSLGTFRNVVKLENIQSNIDPAPKWSCPSLPQHPEDLPILAGERIPLPYWSRSSRELLLLKGVHGSWQ